MNWRLGHVAFWVCLLLAASVLALGALSFSRARAIEFVYRGLRWQVVVERGWVRVDNSPQVIFEKWDLARQERIVAIHARAYLATMIDTRAGPDERTFEIAKATGGKAASRAYVGSNKELGRLKQDHKTTPAARSIHLSIPFFALLLIPASSGFASLRRHRRARNGLCPACGYDLRATADRCPECGAARAQIIPLS